MRSRIAWLAIAAAAASALVAVASSPPAVAGGMTSPPAVAAGVTSTVFSNAAINLDTSGATVPDTDYDYPSTAVFVATTGDDAYAGTDRGSIDHPYQTITKAISAAPAGGTVVLRAGVYRQAYEDSSGRPSLVTKGLTFQAYPHEQVWFDGTDIVTSWRSEAGGRSSIAQNTPSFCNNLYYKANWKVEGNACARFKSNKDPANPESGDPQMVFVDGAALHEVSSLAEVTAGTFFYDWKGTAGAAGGPYAYVDAGSRLYIGPVPAGARVEVTKRSVALKLGAPASTIRGIGFRRYASSAISSSAPVYGGGSYTVGQIVDSVFTQNAGLGVAVESSYQIRHTVASYNGYDGIWAVGTAKRSAQRDGFVLDTSKVIGNNTEGFDYECTHPDSSGNPPCGKAGAKLSQLNGYTVTNSIFGNNVGNGVWCDEKCSNGLIAFNRISRNRSSGDLAGGIDVEVSDTTIVASNLLVGNASGIVVASANSKIYNNTVVGSTSRTIWVYDDSRTAGSDQGTPIGPDTANVAVGNNIMSGDAAVLFDTAPSGAAQTTASTFITALDYNAYARTPRTELATIVRWILKPYGHLSDFTADHPPFESHGLDVVSSSEPFFDGTSSYRVRSDSAASGSAGALPADVRTALGITSTGAFDRGGLLYPGRPN